MSDNSIEVPLIIDESDISRALGQVSNDLGKVEDSASDAENSLDKAFQTGQIRKYGRETDKAARSNDKLDRSIKKTTRSQSRNTRVTNSATNALARYVGVNNKATRGIGGLGVAMGATPFGIFIAGFAAASTILEVFGIDLFGANEGMKDLIESTQKLTEETAKLAAQNEKVAQKQLIASLKASNASIEEIDQAHLDNRNKIRAENIEGINKLESRERLLNAQLKIFRAQDLSDANFAEGTKKEIISEQIKNREADLANVIEQKLKLQLANEDFNIKELQSETDHQKKIVDLSKKKRDVARKAADRLAKELLSLQEKILKEEIKIRLELIIDAQDKEEATREQQAADQIKSINAVFLRQKEIITQQATEEEKLNGSFDSKIASLATQQKNLLTGIETDKQNDLKTIRNKFRSEETEKFKSFLDNIVKLSTENTKKRIEIERAKFATQQEIDRATFFQIERSEQEITDFREGQNEARLRNEKNLQIAILEAVLKGGQDKTKLEKALIKAQIDTLKAEVENIGLDESGTEAQGTNIFSLLGIDLTPEAQEAAISELKKLGELITSELSNQAAERERIASEQIAASDRELDRLNNNLDREIRLLANGDAANLERQKQAIAEQEAIREKAIEDQRKAQQAQFIIDTASQATSLITASANIFKNLSAGFPYTLPLAIGAVGAMFGAFAASRTQAAKAVGFADGGIIPLGRDDRQETTKGYRIGDTNMFVGGGEHITPVAQTRNSLGLLESIRKGELSDVDLDAMHASKNRGVTANIVKIRKERNETKKEAYKEAIREAIHEQTIELGQHLRTIASKPVIVPLPNGDVLKEYDDGTGNKSTTFIKG